MTAEITRVELAERSYDIVIGTDCIPELGTSLLAWWRGQFGAEAENPKALIVTDENVAEFPLRAGIAIAG